MRFVDMSTPISAWGRGIMGVSVPCFGCPHPPDQKDLDDVLWGPTTTLRCFGVPPPHPGCLHPPDLGEGGKWDAVPPSQPRHPSWRQSGCLAPPTPFAFPTPLGCPEVVLALLCVSLSRVGQDPLHVLGEQRLVCASGLLILLGACYGGLMGESGKAQGAVQDWGSPSIIMFVFPGDSTA